MAAWWDRFPGRLEAELEDFKARGLDFELDEALFRDSGKVLLRGELEHAGTTTQLEVLYPDLFPYLRPEVYAPELELERHQNPVLHNLCLLDRNTRAWNPSETGGWLVAERVPKLLSLIEAGSEAMDAEEVPQGEPVSSYFQGVSGTVIFVPGSALELDPEVRVGSGRIAVVAGSPPRVQLRGLLVEMVTRGHSKKHKLLARADEALSKRFSGEQLQMRWARLDHSPDEYSPAGVLEAAEAVQAGFGKPPWQAVAGGELGVTGVVFPEEVQQGVFADTWLFAVRVRRTSGGALHEGAYVIRGERVTPEDLGARIPNVSAVRDAVVAQVGLGAIGAPIALELARNQLGELRALEHDHVEASQTVRWPFGLGAVGHPKLAAVKRFIEGQYPYTDVTSFQHRLGETALQRHGREENEFDVLERLLSGADLVIDSTAEYGIQQLVADVARALGIPQLFASATEGARGGQIALIVPERGGCWYCWKQYSLDGSIPLPSADPEATVQPRGCSSPTFTGASFDLLPVIAQAVRVVAGSLAVSDVESTVWVCDLPADPFSPPAWNVYPLLRHPDCPSCASD